MRFITNQAIAIWQNLITEKIIQFIRKGAVAHHLIVKATIMGSIVIQGMFLFHFLALITRGSAEVHYSIYNVLKIEKNVRIECLMEITV